MDDIEELVRVDPGYISWMRLRGLLVFVALMIAALVLESRAALPLGIALVPAALFGLWHLLILPGARYRRLGYALGKDCLRVSRGYLLHSDTVVPLGRIQHIDVDQGLLMKPWEIATLKVHTAGSSDKTVSLEGLPHAEALAMRDTIRAHIGSALS